MRSALDEYLERLKGKRVAVLGIGVSNRPLIDLLCQAGIAVTACDKRDRDSFNGLIEKLEANGVSCHLGPDYLDHLDGMDVIFRTPGLRPDLPQLERAKAAGAELTSEMEAFSPCVPAASWRSLARTERLPLLRSLLACSVRPATGPM